MSAEQMTELDTDILAAFAALDETVPEGYFDDFETRLQVRIEETAMTELSDPTAAQAAAQTTASIDDDELRDIRALAASTRERVSQRMSAVNKPDEPLISSVSLALKAISLPEPGKDFKFFAVDDTPKAAAAASSAVEAREERDSGLPVWIYAGISAVAAAAIMFFVLRGGDNKTEPVRSTTGDQAAAPVADGTGTMGTNPATGAALADPAMGQTPGASANRGADLGQPGESRAALAPADSEPDDSAMAIPGAAEKSGDSPEGQGAVSADAKPADKSDGASGTARATAPSSTRSAKKSRSSKKRREDKKAASAEDSEPVEAKKTAKKKKKKPDTLESLLSEASGGVKDGNGKKKPAGEAKKPTRKKIETSELRKKMNGLSGKTRKCYEKYQQIGLVMTRFSVAPAGNVTSVKISGKFKGTDTGKCVAAAVKTVKFDPFDGPPSSFNWPFTLTQ